MNECINERMIERKKLVEHCAMITYQDHEGRDYLDFVHHDIFSSYDSPHQRVFFSERVNELLGKGLSS